VISGSAFTALLRACACRRRLRSAKLDHNSTLTPSFWRRDPTL
jgi:hypothetical protein